MKEILFVDTGDLVARVNQKDTDHSKAIEINNHVKENTSKYVLVFTDYIFDEFIANASSPGYLAPGHQGCRGKIVSLKC